ncbi:MAG: hypothetical protein DRJ35_03290 [Thermoprotei archaeon]|nr:MAG: hypothetical protein DRJ35_03290 [Thermoprotei archaeon]
MSLTLNALTGLTLGVLSGIPLGIWSIRKGYIDKKAATLSIIFSGLYFMSGLGVFLLALLFYFSSSILTKYRYGVKLAKSVTEPPQGRKWTQVVGAGGVAAILSLLSAFLDYFEVSKLTLIIASVLAVSTADTWAVEIGATSDKKPRLIVAPWRYVEPGVSGGVTLRGEIASFLGALFIATAYFVLSFLGIFSSITLVQAMMIAMLGWFGEVLDSILGATVQVKYRCPVCGKLTDQEVHVCGARTEKAWGFTPIKNEVTNVISTSLVALIAFLLF